MEAKLGANNRTLPTCEAADVLAMLYMARSVAGMGPVPSADREKNRQDAQKAVDFGLGVLNYLSLLGKTNYIEALLRGRLQSNIASPEAERLFPAYLEAVGRLVAHVDGWSVA